MITRRRGLTLLELLVVIAIVAVALVLLLGAWTAVRCSLSTRRVPQLRAAARGSVPSHGLGTGDSKRIPVVDTSGLGEVLASLPRWDPDASLKDVSDIWNGTALRTIEVIDQRLADAALTDAQWIMDMFTKAALLHYEGHPAKSYEVLSQIRAFVEQDQRLASKLLASVVYYQGIAAMRRGEDANCIMCRGESSCILPIAPAAVHVNPTGASSRSNISPNTSNSSRTTSRSPGY